LIEQINQTTVDHKIQGLAAFLIGICFEYNTDEVVALTRHSIQSVILNRIGADQFVNRLTRLKDSSSFSRFSVRFPLRWVMLGGNGTEWVAGRLL
jgi:hypothetical protein